MFFILHVCPNTLKECLRRSASPGCRLAASLLDIVYSHALLNVQVDANNQHKCHIPSYDTPGKVKIGPAMTKFYPAKCKLGFLRTQISRTLPLVSTYRKLTQEDNSFLHGEWMTK